MISKLEKLFRISKETVGLRSEFLKKFFVKYPSQYVKELIYTSGEEKLDIPDDAPFREEDFEDDELPKTLAFCDWDLTKMGKGVKSSIIIYPESFLLSYLSFWNAIVNHEYFHAKDAFSGIYLFDGGRIDCSNIEEMPTLLDDRIRFHDRGLNPLGDFLQARAYNNEIKNTEGGTLRELKREMKNVTEFVKDYLEEFKILYKEESEISGGKNLSLLGRASYTLINDIKSTLKI